MDDSGDFEALPPDPHQELPKPGRVRMSQTFQAKVSESSVPLLQNQLFCGADGHMSKNVPTKCKPREGEEQPPPLQGMTVQGCESCPPTVPDQGIPAVMQIEKSMG